VRGRGGAAAGGGQDEQTSGRDRDARAGLAGARAVTPAELAGHRIWMPGLAAGTEWAAFYHELAAAFGLTVDVIGPNFGTEPLLETVAGSPDLATFVGEQTHLVWPADYGLRRIAVHDPTPVYPHSLIWRRGNPHPGLAALRRYLRAAQPSDPDPTPGPGHRIGRAPCCLVLHRHFG
jgi:hypothetical protein